MNNNFNKAHLVGRLGKDPEITVFESGAIVSKSTIAVNRPSSTDEEPDWFGVECWNKTAQVFADYARKGSLVGLEGEFKLDEWTDKASNEPRYRPTLKVSRLHLLSSQNAETRGQKIAGAVEPATEEDF